MRKPGILDPNPGRAYCELHCLSNTYDVAWCVSAAPSAVSPDNPARPDGTSRTNISRMEVTLQDTFFLDSIGRVPWVAGRVRQCCCLFESRAVLPHGYQPCTGPDFATPAPQNRDIFLSATGMLFLRMLAERCPVFPSLRCWPLLAESCLRSWPALRGLISRWLERAPPRALGDF